MNEIMVGLMKLKDSNDDLWTLFIQNIHKKLLRFISDECKCKNLITIRKHLDTKHAENLQMMNIMIPQCMGQNAHFVMTSSTQLHIT